MRGPQCFRVASWLAPLLLMACSSDSVAPASPSTGSNASSATAATDDSAAPAAAPAPAAPAAPVAAANATAAATASLAGTSWQLVRFEGGDGAVLVPDDGSKYTLQFGADGSVAVRLDCNRGRGTWKEPQPGSLELGPMALTRAACPPGSLHDQIARQWTYIRSYVMRNGHLLLSLMADGGIYEFAPVAAAARAAVAGSATYRERMALTADDVFEATLEDVSRVGAAAEILSRVRLPAPGQVPIHFNLEYDAGRIDPKHRYVVRARILRAGQPLFVTDTVAPVDFAGTTPQELVLIRARAAGTESTASLTNTYWKLLAIGDAPVPAAPGTREVHLILQPDQQRVAGFSGCNRLMGSYKVDGARLTFSQMAGTMMACPPPAMDLERGFHAMLQKVAGWRINGEKLDLLDDSGAVLAGFESRYMQ